MNGSGTKIEDPASFNIVTANNAITKVKNLVAGIYQFELKVMDAGGLYGKDTVEVILSGQTTICSDCKIVFVSSRDGNDEIYTCKPDGSNINRLTYNSGANDQPAWSPDGAAWGNILTNGWNADWKH